MSEIVNKILLETKIELENLEKKKFSQDDNVSKRDSLRHQLAYLQQVTGQYTIEESKEIKEEVSTHPKPKWKKLFCCC